MDLPSVNNQMNVQGKNKKVANVGNSGDSEFQNPFGFEQPLKKIKLEDQSDEIQRFNETINKLRGNVETQTQIIKSLKEDNLKLQKEVSNVQILQMDIQKQIIKNLKDENVKFYKEIANLKGLKVDVQNQTQIINDLREENSKLYEENANLKYSK